MDNKQLFDLIYKLGLEKCAGDDDGAREFTIGFLKEAADFSFGNEVAKGVAGTLGASGAALLAGLAIHGISSGFQNTATHNLRGRFEAALKTAVASNPLLQSADPERLNSYAETMFKFAPHIASDPNLLSNILSSAIHGESMDLTTIRTLADLESRYTETKKNALFTPKLYTK